MFPGWIPLEEVSLQKRSPVLYLENQIPAPVFDSVNPITSDKDRYKNGQTITLTVNLNSRGFTLTADFSDIDSEYGPGSNMESVVDNGDSTYTIYYTISPYNTIANGFRAVIVTARDKSGHQAQKPIVICLDNALPVFDSITSDKSTYKNGDVIELTVSLDDSNYILSTDFSPIDSKYGQGSNTESVVDSGDTTYQVLYTINNFNTRDDSSYTVIVAASDKAGNATSSSIILKLDNTPPVFISSTQANQTIYKNGEIITLIAHLDSSGYQLKADFSNIDSEYKPGDERFIDWGMDGVDNDGDISIDEADEQGWYSIIYTISQDNKKTDGYYQIIVSAIDEAGNEVKDSEHTPDFSVWVNLDNTSPEFLGIIKAGTFIDDGDGKIEDGEMNWAPSPPYPPPFYLKGGDTIVFQAQLDAPGYAESPAAVAANFLPIDSKYTMGGEQPAIPGNTLPDYLDNNQNGKINEDVEANYYLIKYTINSLPENIRDDGQYSINVTVTDKAGHSTIKSVYADLILDNHPPYINSVNIYSTEGSWWLSGTVTDKQIVKIEVNLKDSESGLNIEKSKVELLTPQGNPVGNEPAIDRGYNTITLIWSEASPPLTVEGKYTIKVTSYDLVGNSAINTDYSFVYDKSAPILVSTFPANNETLNSPVTFITATLQDKPDSFNAGLDLEDCEIALFDNNGNVLDRGGEAVSEDTIKLSSTPGQVLAGKTGTYYIQVTSKDYAGNEGEYTHTFYLNLDPVKEISQACMKYKGNSFHSDLISSTNRNNPVVFSNDKIDEIYLQINLRSGANIDEDVSNIDLYKIISLVSEEKIEGTSNITSEQGKANLIFYPYSIFNPDVDNHAKDGFYWVKAEIKDILGNSHQIDFFFVYDTTPPLPPFFEMESFDRATGMVTISGITQPESSEPQQVQIFINGEYKESVTADTTGNFSKEVALKKGENSINVRAMDRAGNIGDFTSSSIKLNYKPDRLLSIIFRSSRILKSGSSLTPVKVVYYLSEPAKVTIRIYNLIGEIVKDWEEYLSLGDEKEWVWWGKNMYGEEVNNGVYILRVTAKSSSRQETVTKLVGVLR